MHRIGQDVLVSQIFSGDRQRLHGAGRTGRPPATTTTATFHLTPTRHLSRIPSKAIDMRGVMDQLLWALGRVTADIEQLQPELDRLRLELEQKMQRMERLQQRKARLLEAQEVIKELSSNNDSSGHQRPTSEPTPHHTNSESQVRYIDASTKIMLANARAMGVAEVQKELKKDGILVDYNVLSSLFSRESKKSGGRIRRIAPGQYIPMVQEMPKQEESTGEITSEGGVVVVPKHDGTSELDRMTSSAHGEGTTGRGDIVEG
jgi:hypothetical protein